jgi:hypothetical protein
MAARLRNIFSRHVHYPRSSSGRRVWYDHGRMEDNLRDLLEAVNFIKERMATKDDIIVLDGRLDHLDAKVDRILHAF